MPSLYRRAARLSSSASQSGLPAWPGICRTNCVQAHHDDVVVGLLGHVCVCVFVLAWPRKKKKQQKKTCECQK